MLLSFVYLGAMLMIQLRPVWFYVINSSDRIHGALYAVGAVVLTLSVGLIPMELGARRLAKQEH